MAKARPASALTRTSALTVVAALTLSGCTTKWDEPLDPIIWSVDITQTPSPTPTEPPAPPVAGDVVDKDTAIKLRRDLSDELYAYEMPDGTWVVINVLEPIPPAVMEAERALAWALPKPVTPYAYEAFEYAHKHVGGYPFRTGRNLLFVHQELTSNHDGYYPVHSLTWHVSPGTAIGNNWSYGLNQFSNADDAVALAQLIIDQQGEPHMYDIIVGNPY